jgi:hypothetical protein
LLLVRANPEKSAGSGTQGDVYFLATLPGTRASSLARDGVVLFAFLHRILDAASGSLGSARQRDTGAGALGDPATAAAWRRLAAASPAEGAQEISSDQLPYRAGILENGERLLALNRPESEDLTKLLAAETLAELFAGLDHRIIEDTLQDEKSLASEIWRTFLFIMAAALILEALLSMPNRRAAPANPVSPPAKPATV